MMVRRDAPAAQGQGAPGDAEKDVRPGIAARRKGSGTAQSAMAGARLSAGGQLGEGKGEKTLFPGTDVSLTLLVPRFRHRLAITCALGLSS